MASTLYLARNNPIEVVVDVNLADARVGVYTLPALGDESGGVVKVKKTSGFLDFKKVLAYADSECTKPKWVYRRWDPCLNCGPEDG